jgi:hypothetical protein
VDVENVWVRELSYRFRFPFESFNGPPTLGYVSGDDLDRDRSSELRIPSSIDLSHPAGAQEVDDLIAPKCLPFKTRHDVISPSLSTS